MSESDEYFSLSETSEDLWDQAKPHPKLKPDGKLASICTLVMVFTAVIGFCLYNDEDFTDLTAKKILEAEDRFRVTKDTTLDEKKANARIAERTAKEQSYNGLVLLPFICAISQLISLYIFMTAKPKSNGQPNYKMFTVVGMLMSIAGTTTVYQLVKNLLDFSGDYNYIGMNRLYWTVPMVVSFFTTLLHCWVYYNLFQTVSSKNIDHTLHYTLAAAEQHQINRFTTKNMEKNMMNGEPQATARSPGTSVPMAGSNLQPDQMRKHSQPPVKQQHDNWG